MANRSIGVNRWQPLEIMGTFRHETPNLAGNRSIGFKKSDGAWDNREVPAQVHASSGVDVGTSEPNSGSSRQRCDYPGDRPA
jgi:hypothetical protein